MQQQLVSAACDDHNVIQLQFAACKGSRMLESPIMWISNHLWRQVNLFLRLERAAVCIQTRTYRTLYFCGVLIDRLMRAAPGRGRAALGKKIVATTQLFEEVAISQYALHAGIHLQHIKSVWRDLWGHVATQLRIGKVRLPEPSGFEPVFQG